MYKYHGAGQSKVSMSEMAMPSRTMLVEEIMCFRERTMTTRVFERMVSTNKNGMIYPNIHMAYSMGTSAVTFTRYLIS